MDRYMTEYGKRGSPPPPRPLLSAPTQEPTTNNEVAASAFDSSESSLAALGAVVWSGLPRCPNPGCGRALGGVFRHDHVLRAAVQALEPVRLCRLEESYRADTAADLAAGLAEEVAQRLTAKLGTLQQRSKPHPLEGLLHRLLGEALLTSGHVKKAEAHMKQALDSETGATDPSLRTEASYFWALCKLGGATALGPANAEASAQLLPLDTLREAAAQLQTIDISKEVLGSSSSTSASELLVVLARVVREREARLAHEEQELEQRSAQVDAARSRLQRKVEDRLSSTGDTPGSAEEGPAAQQARLSAAVANEVKARGGSALHLAAARGRADQVRSLLLQGVWAQGSAAAAAVEQVDMVGDTPLHLAVRGRHLAAVRLLLDTTPWCMLNKAGRTPLDDALCKLPPGGGAGGGGGGGGGGETMKTPPGKSAGADIARVRDDDRDRFTDGVAVAVREAIEGELNKGSEEAQPEREWAAARVLEREVCGSMDELMQLTGLRAVKVEAMKLYRTVKTDLQRPEASRTGKRHALNFIFYGNPGTGKTTVARLFGGLLKELGLRKSDELLEYTGQQLLDEGSSKFTTALDELDGGGVVFVDEVYQLEPASDREGRALTNAILSATEEKRTTLTFIAAGYKDDVQEKWLAANDGLRSRFPYELNFEDFNEGELRAIFTRTVGAEGWRVDDEAPVDVAAVAAKRLFRSAGKKGFANARSVRVLVEQAQRRANDRLSRASRGQHKGATLTTLTLDDVLGPVLNPKDSEALVALMTLPGLDAVKKAAKGLVQLARDNRRREEQLAPVQDISLHRLFLGNPGTGKTTVSKLYGRLLRELGFLSKGDVTVVGASKLTGYVVGSTASKVNALLDKARGCVLVIDECYVLAKSVYGKEALDTLVERVQGGPGEDFAVLLCGYTTETEDMLRTCNPGLKRRFKADEAFQFEDYDDAALATIMTQMAQQMGLHFAPGLPEQAVANVLSKQRLKPNFGNAGAVLSLLEKGVHAMSLRRQASAASLASDEGEGGGEGAAGVLTIDELIAEDLFEAPTVNARAALDHLINAEGIVSHIDDLEKRIKSQKRRGKTRPEELLKNYMFVGPPGTGKTTVARAFGEVFHNLELLADSRVVECKGQDLLADYVGQSKTLVNEKMDDARGAILFIDEAYSLAHGARAQKLLGGAAGNLFAKDALEALLANLTDPKYQGKMVVILAGYTQHMEAVLASNPGLPRRFSERLVFKDWDEGACVKVVRAECHKKAQLSIPSRLDGALCAGFKELIQREGWGNAGDAVTVASKIQASCEAREGDVEGDDSVVVTEVTEEDVASAFKDMLGQRRHKTNPPTGEAEEATARSFFQAMPPPPQLTALQGHNGFAQNKDKGKAKSAASPEKARTAKLQREREGKAASARAELSPVDSLLASLQQALNELGYDLERALDIVASRNLPTELLEHVAAQKGTSAAKARVALLSQCPTLQPRLQAALTQQQAEAERRRLAQEAIELAAESERAHLREEEAERQRIMMGAFICGVCGRMGCPVMPIWQTWTEGEAPPVGRY